jgi:hypothetical protein
MTYDIALWKAKAKTSDSVGLIAITLCEGSECRAVSRFPKAKVTDRLKEIFGCSFDELPFEADITGQGAVLSLSHSDSLGCLDALAKLAQELGLYKYAGKKSPFVLVQGEYSFLNYLWAFCPHICRQRIFTGEKHLLGLMAFGQLYALN